MNSIFTVARYEFLRFVKNKSFYISILVIAAISLVALFGVSKLDPSGLFKFKNDKIGIYGLQNPVGKAEEAVIFGTKESGMNSLINGDIGRLIIFAPDHIETGECEVYTTTAQNKFVWILGVSANVDSLALPSIIGSDEAISKRISEGYSPKQLIVDASGTIQDFSQRRSAFGLAFMVAILLLSFFMMVASYITDVIVKDKADKVIETILSSISPFIFLTGRVIAACAAGILQVLLFFAFVSLLSVPTTSSALIQKTSYIPLLDMPSNELPSGIADSQYDSIASSLQNSGFASLFANLAGINLSALLGILPFLLVGFALCISIATFIGSISPRNAIAGRFSTLFLLLTIGSTFLSIGALTTPMPSLNYIPVISIPIIASLIYAEEISFLSALASLLVNLGFAAFLYFLAIKIYQMNFTMHGKSLINIKDFVRAIR